MLILGISCFYHDSAAVLLQDGILVAAADEERFSRIKHDFGFPELAIEFCINQAGVTFDDLDYVVFYEKPMLKLERLLMTIFGTIPRSWKVFQEAMVGWIGDKLWIKGLIKERLEISEDKILFVEHHVSHAASSFLCAPFEEAAILTVDGVGEWVTATTGVGRTSGSCNTIQLHRELRFPHSLGLLYSVFTAFLGFQVNEGEYKVMGMASYGNPKYVDRVMRVLDLKDDGSFGLDMSYFSYHFSPERTFSRKFEDLFGTPRSPDARFVTRQTSLYDDKIPPTSEELERNQYYADVAASIQKVTEETVLRMANHLHEETGLDKLCVAGGVGLNSVANYRILKETPFNEVFIQPAAGDSGGALGAALYAYNVLLGKSRKFTMEHAYWGQEHKNSTVSDFLRDKGIAYEEINDDEQLFDRVVEYIMAGKVVGWYQGRFEWGPRALGNRSILADARRADMKDIVNIKIKFREPFRPFAPSVLSECAGEYFDLPDISRNYPARFMLMVAPVCEEKRAIIPAVTHVDGTARIQTVFKDESPRYHRLIEKFGEATSVPLLLNTSFNLKGEPIVNTPENAYHTFSSSGMDVLVLENCLVCKD